MNSPPFLARMRQFAPLLLILISALVVIGAYLQALNYPFINDDETYVSFNTKLAGLRLSELWRLLAEPYNAMEFLPLRDLSYWFDMALFGLAPPAFRMHNIILYLLCLSLVYGATLSMWRHFRPMDAASTPLAAAAVTALFALHPAHVEAVVWISGRKDVLSAMFSLLALWFAAGARRERGFSTSYAVITLVALLAAMISKATAVAMAPLIALFWVILWRDIPAPERRRSLLLWPLASLMLAVCVTLIFAANSTVKAPAYFGIEVVTRALAVLGWLTRLAASPEGRHFYYPVFEDPSLSIMVALGGVVLAAAVAGMVMILRKRSLEWFSVITFLLLCMPYMQLIPYKTISLVSDRFLALAVWPAMMLLVALSWRLKPVLRAAFLLAIALPWCFQTIERPRDWRSYEALIEADLRTFPGYYMAAANKIGAIQLPQGLYREARDTANSITTPEFRDIAVKWVEADYAVHVDAVSNDNPREAMMLLRQLEMDLRQLPIQAKWNLPIAVFWGREQLALKDEWKYLVEHFPDDAWVRYYAGM